ncbi:RidA family protein [Paenibacillus methanolicus]|uniref:Enamine deaminase RidA (YjgF/YER057c/UK114 family) n=1 Tax=Paenibacillus methanolicus TaxID=582686 RepID=A0A5S5C3X8_9BACL|nr:RidA family protein [Paenibacillus methanolicus]TYP74034.1 enamine deaminase RidA (YjgF/YER057c/UK114 family) [Paenibacillus methanolicus]
MSAFDSALSAEARLAQLGISLPQESEPAANYANVVFAGSLLFVSGKGPAGRPSGKLGQTFATEDGYRFARSAGLEIVAVVRQALGSLDRVARVVKLQGFVNAAPTFGEHHLVLNGCSDLMRELFGERGIHSRSVLGANSLRDDLPVIIDSVFQIAN